MCPYLDKGFVRTWRARTVKYQTTTRRIWHWISVRKLLRAPSTWSETSWLKHQIYAISITRNEINGILGRTSLHSSMMHTARLLTVSPSIHCSQGGVCSRGGLLPGGCLLGGGGLLGGGVSAPREGVSQHALRQTLPPVNRILDTRYWKYYLAPNFVCGR